MECSCKKVPWWSRQVILGFKLALQTGSVLAVTMSWEKYHHVGYSLYVAFAGWFYVAMPNFFDKTWMA